MFLLTTHVLQTPRRNSGLGNLLCNFLSCAPSSTSGFVGQSVSQSAGSSVGYCLRSMQLMAMSLALKSQKLEKAPKKFELKILDV